ncbi:hypothetical protein [Streptomyces sp. NPDC056549]|uniref:hypothetical protein n=1 Tax=Streptomyces sp. NPDC056549 TaxID=3345864 RepID=UPI003685C4EC
MPETFTAVPPLATYWDWNYDGASRTREIPEKCNDNGTWDWGYTDLSGWNDGLGSVLPANNCWVALYSDIHYTARASRYLRHPVRRRRDERPGRLAAADVGE